MAPISSNRNRVRNAAQVQFGLALRGLWGWWRVSHKALRTHGVKSARNGPEHGLRASAARIKLAKNFVGPATGLLVGDAARVPVGRQRLVTGGIGFERIYI